MDSTLHTDSHDFRNGAKPIENNLEQMSSDAGRKMGALTSNFANSSSEYVKKGRGYVRDNPATGVAIAAVTGAVVGSLVTMAMKRRH